MNSQATRCAVWFVYALGQGISLPRLHHCVVGVDLCMQSILLSVSVFNELVHYGGL